MKPIAMRCNTSQYKKIKPILLQNGFIEEEISSFEIDPYLVNNRWGHFKKLCNYSNGNNYDRTVFEEWDEDIFLEYCGIKWQLPEKWCVKITEENAVILGEFYAKHSFEGYKQKIPNVYVGKYVTSHNAFSHDSLFSKCPGSNFCIDSPTYFKEISFEQFQTYVLKQKPNTMQTLTLGQLKDLYTVSDCSKWQSKIGSYLGDNLLKKDDFKIEIKSEDIQLLLKEGTLAQQNAVEKLGIALSNPIEWNKIKTGSKVMLKRTESICVGSSDGLDFDKPFNVIFFKTPYYMLNVGFRKCSNYTYCVFNQDGKFATFQAQNNTDYIVSVIEY